MDDAEHLQRACGIPLYYQIFSLLRDNIIVGLLPKDSLLPTEEELAAKFDVGRVTARRAVQELVGIGLVERRPRLGTRVIYDTATMRDSEGNDASNILSTLDRETVRMVEYTVVDAPPKIARLLKLDSDEKIIRASRMRVFGADPVGLVEIIVPERLKHIVSRKNLLRSHLHMLLREAGLCDLKFEQMISSVGATPHLASMLKVDPRSPILCVERVIRDGSGQHIAMTITHFRADRVRLEFDSDGDFGSIAPILVR